MEKRRKGINMTEKKQASRSSSRPLPSADPAGGQRGKMGGGKSNSPRKKGKKDQELDWGLPLKSSLTEWRCWSRWATERRE